MTNEIKGGGSSQVFDYKQVDEQTAEFLRRKETIIWSAYETMIETVGGELKDAQERLAGSNQYDGVFEKWYTALGFTKQTVYNYISYHSVVKLVDEQKLKIDVEELPKKLVYAIGSQSSESSPEKAQAKSEVLAGNIDTLKAYRERIAELESENEQKDQRAIQAERQADIERKQRERLEEEVEHLSEREPEIRYETKTEYIEVGVEEPYNRMNDEPFSVERGNEFYSMMREIDELYKKYAHLKDSVEELRGIATYDDDMKLKYRKADEFWRMIGNIFRESNTNIIDVEII